MWTSLQLRRDTTTNTKLHFLGWILKGYSGVNLIHGVTRRDTEYDPPREIKFADC